MTLIPGGRAATDALNEALHKPRRGVRADRETEHHPRVHLFGHYDSRGGASLIIGKTTAGAMEHYNNGFGLDPEWDVAGDDYIGRYELIICDCEGELPPEQELLKDYDGEYTFGRIQSRYIDHNGKPSKWHNTEAVMLWKGKATKLFDDGQCALKYEYRVRKWNVGEDAFGLYYM